MTWSLPETCFSCVHYKQQGYKSDEHAPNTDKYGFPQEQKKQRHGLCSDKGCHVFWNERKCPAYVVEPGIATHACQARPVALQPHQDPLF